MSRIAVLGSGISGLASAWLLSQEHEVTLFEKDTRLGGHTHTHQVKAPEGPVAVDTGFIAHHPATYPNFSRLMGELDIETAPSEVSFAASGVDLPWCSRGLNGLFCERHHLLSLSFYRFWAEILRFNKEAPELLREAGAEALGLAGWLRRQGFSDTFKRNYLLPLAGAVWRMPMKDMETFPALTLARFFMDHGFLGSTPSGWRTISGGTSRYIEKLAAPFRERIVLGARPVSVRRTEFGVYVHLEGADKVLFDDIVFAVHGDQVLPLLADSSTAERQVFSAFTSQRNPATLHRDAGLLPSHRRAWASWNFRRDDEDRLLLTAHMNRLQPLTTKTDHFVTLHAEGRVQEDLVLAHMDYEHPRFTVDAIRAQGRWEEVSGARGVQGRTHYAGAYWGYGLHEDGLNSALRVAESFGIRWP